MYSKLYIVVLLTFLLNKVNTINILGIFEIPSRSVHILGQELLLGLWKRGYNVTLMSSFPLDIKPVHNYSHVYLDGLLEYKEKNYEHMIQGDSKLGVLTMINAQINFANLAMKTKNFQDFIKSDSKYDIIIQVYALNEAYLGLADHFDARVIGFIPFGSFPHIDDLTGNTSPLSYVSLPLLGFTQNMNFSQRTINTLVRIFMTLLHKFYLFPKQAEILKTYFPTAPPLEEIQSERVDLIFANVHFSNEPARPKTPNIIHIGGYHVQQPEPLSDDLKKYLDDSQKGVVYLGFGSNVDTSKLSKEKLDPFLNAFAKTSYNVLFKYKGELPNKPENVRIGDWFPQRGILAHPNTKLFISHGGKGSATESLYYGVPTLCVSFYGDQKKNCEDIQDYGYGIHLPFHEVTNESFLKAFNELTENPKYMQNAKYRAALFQEQEMDPLDRASFWIEHIFKFKGAKHLQPRSATMPLYQYLLLDVWAFILVVVSLILLMSYKIMKFLKNLICKKSQTSKKKDKIKRN